MHENKSYLDIKVTFTHIIILLIAVIMIGIFLFYIGFNAGKNEKIINKPFQDVSVSSGKSDELIFNKKEDIVSGIDGKNETDINKELGLFENVKKRPESIDPEPETIKAPRTMVRDTYYSIQVGSFKSHTLAKNYAKRFTVMGYQTDISQFHSGNDLWFRVKVGNFKTLKQANIEKVKLENMEKKKFQTVKLN